MTIVGRPSGPSASLLGGSIQLSRDGCRHGVARPVRLWAGEPGTAGTVAIIGAGTQARSLSARCAGHGWSVTIVDAEQAGMDASATKDAESAAREADVVVLAVPVLLDDEQQPDYRDLDAAVAAIGPGVHSGSTVIFETALPVGDTRSRFIPRLEAASGLQAEREFFVAFSPHRMDSSAGQSDLATYPKLVGGIGPVSGDRAAAYYDSVLEGEVVLMSSAEAAELSMLAETTYRDVNIALANELARYADRVGIDVQEVIAAANGQPASHLHQPGLGVGGPTVPVHPHFLLARAPEMELVELSRRVNDGQVGVAIRTIQRALGGLEDVPVLVLGLTYCEGVKELAYSRAMPLIERLGFHGARVSAYDPLLSTDEIDRRCAAPYRWGDGGSFRAIVTQTADPLFRTLDFAAFPDLAVVFDGRNSLRDLAYPPGVAYRGVGVQATTRPAADVAGT